MQSEVVREQGWTALVGRSFVGAKGTNHNHIPGLWPQEHLLPTLAAPGEAAAADLLRPRLDLSVHQRPGQMVLSGDLRPLLPAPQPSPAPLAHTLLGTF